MRIRTLMICLLAVCALGAVASASASASNLEWEVCKEGGTEKYTEHKCSNKGATGKWSWTKLAAGVKEKVVSEGGAFTLVVFGDHTITCKKVKDKGTLTGGKPGTGLAEEITFEECTTEQGGCKVRSAGGTFGTIVMTNIPIKLEERTTSTKAIVIAVNFEQNPTTKEFTTLQYEAEPGKSCSSYPEGKLKGAIAAEAVGSGELNFPSPELVGNTWEMFDSPAKMTGKMTQAVVQSFTETVAQGSSVRAS
jgi:hypothetical protein